MRVNNVSSNTNFKAKFIHTEDLKSVVEWSVKNNKFDKLNQSRKNIDSAYVQRKIKFELKENNGYPIAYFTLYTPVSEIKNGKLETKYKASSKVQAYPANRQIEPLEYGYNLLIKLGNSVPLNKMFKKIVANK